MQDISENRELIDEFEDKIKSFKDKSLWQKSSGTDWYEWITLNGPKIIKSWRELAGMMSILTGDELLKLMNEWDKMLAMVNRQQALAIAIKYSQRNNDEETQQE